MPDKDEPERYWPSASDPGYKNDLFFYVHLHNPPDWREKREREQAARWPFERIRGYVKTIKSDLEHPDQLASQEAISCAVEAIQKFGVDALCPPRVWRHRELRRQYEVRFLRLALLSECLTGLIEKLQIDVSTGIGGSQPKKQLQKILNALIPESRGRKKKVSARTIKMLYYKELYRLYHIRNALKKAGKTRTAKVKEASLNFGMPVERIRELWKLDENDQTTVRPIPIKEMARILTADFCKVTQQTVSNAITAKTYL